MTEPITFLLPADHWVTVGPGHLDSNLHDYPGARDQKWAAATNAFESLLLAQASAGIDMETKAMHEAVATAFDAIIQRYTG